MNLLRIIRETCASILTIGKVLLMSRCPFRASRMDGEIVILGNGPALRSAIDDNFAALAARPRLAVNFAANTPEFIRLAPQYYILADNHFFQGEASDPNVARLWRNLGETTWKMVLFVPCPKVTNARRKLSSNRNIRIKGYNLTPGEGLRGVSHFLYRNGLAMPRPRNVLIPAIMVAMRMGYSKIWLCGADHSWSRTLDVDDRNRVISVQPHFYKDTTSERQRVDTEYAGYHLHDIFRSLYIAFRSYHYIADYARSRNVTILNATPGSMIDAFSREPLS